KNLKKLKRIVKLNNMANTPCPNKNLPEWKLLVDNLGEDEAYRIFIANGYEVPELNAVESLLTTYPDKNIQCSLIATNRLQNPKAINWFNSLYKKGRVDEFLNKIQKDLQIPKQQVEIIRSLAVSKEYNSLEELIIDFSSAYSYTVSINLSKIVNTNIITSIDPDTGEERFYEKNTDYYSNLTVLGGTNYEENRITTPQIIPVINGHAQFAEDTDIGWFRSDE